MNKKRGLKINYKNYKKIKFLFTFLLVILFFIPISPAFISEKNYFIGDELRVDLSGIEDYVLRIETPEKVFIKEGSDDVFILQLNEIGRYFFNLESEEHSESYNIDVLEKVVENKSIIADNFNSKNNSEIKSDSIDEKEEINILEDSYHENYSNKNSSIIIGKPVKKTKKYLIEDFENETIIKIPFSAENIQVLFDGENFSEFKIRESFFNSIGDFLSDSAEKEVILKGISGKIELVYYLPGPEKSEKIISEKKKKITVSAPDSYEYKNILAYTELDDTLPLNKKNLIKIYWEEGERYLDFEVFDEDNDGSIDKVEWVVPHLSEQNFEVSIDVLNVQSYPLVGSNWKVSFQTIGISDLKITGVNGTKFGEDLQFLDIMCGSKKLNYEFSNNSILIENYSCDENGFEISEVLTGGVHSLEFDFGGVKAYAHNFASQPWWDDNYLYRKQINVTTGANVPYKNYSDYTVQLSIDTSGLVSQGKMQSDADDLRIIYFNGSDNIELDRIVFNSGTSNTLVRFKLQENISSSSVDSNYFIYYGKSSAVNPPENYSNIYLWYDDASSDKESDYIQGRLDESAHGGDWANSISWSSSGYYIFDTGDNYADSFRVSDILERDVYVEYEEYQTNSYPNDMTSGPLIRWEGTGSGATETSSHWYYYEIAASTFSGGGYQSHDDITADDRGSVVISNGTLGDFPGNSWTKIGIASWNINPTNLASWYDASPLENESGGWVSSRFSGTHAAGSDNENPGQAGIWIQQDQGRFRNILIRRYISPEPSLFLNSEENQTPIISDINATEIKDSSAKIVWDTNILANSTVEYGLTPDLLDSNSDSFFSLTHSVIIIGLDSNTTYFYNISSCSEPGFCSELGTFNFTTALLTPPDIFNISPSNDSIVSVPVTLSATTNEDAFCQYSTLETFNYGAGTNFSSGQGTTFHSTSLGILSDGNYNYYIKCNDLDGAENDDSNQGSTTFEVDGSPPSIIINFPLDSSTIADVTPILNISLNETVGELWYTIDSGQTNYTLCRNCGGTQINYLHLPEGNYNLEVYANDSLGNIGVASSYFIINMNNSYFDNFNDNSSISEFSEGVFWNEGNISFTTNLEQNTFFEGWESGIISGNWTTYSSAAEGRIQATSSNGPNSGDYHLTMDVSTNNLYNLNEIITNFDFSDASNIILDFYEIEWGDEDNTCPSSWAGHNNCDGVAYTCDGTTWYNIYSLTGGNSGASYSQKGPINISNDPDFCSEINSSFAIKFQQYDNFPLINDGIGFDDINITYLSTDKTSGNLTFKSINTSNTITKIENITWEEFNTDVNNNLTLQISSNYGENWYDVINGFGLEDIVPGDALLYRALFETNSALTIYLDNLSIIWSNETILPPNVTINFPLDSSTIADVTPALNVTLDKNVHTLWYTIDSGQTNYTLCRNCGGTQINYLHLPEGNYNLEVYANDSANRIGFDNVSFTIDVNFGYYDNFNDNSSIEEMNNGVSWNQGNISFTDNSPLIEFQRASGSTGTSHTIDIGNPGNNRLVAVFLDDESTSGANFQGTVSIGSVNARQLVVSDNPSGVGNHQELHVFNESALGSLSGNQTITYSGGDSGWAMHVMVFYNVKEANAYDFQIDDTSSSQAEILPDAVDIPQNGLLIFGAANGQSGTYNDNDWDTNPTEGTDDGLSPEIEMTEVTDGPNPSSAVLATAYWISSTTEQTNRLFRARGSNTNNLRGTGIIASFEPLDRLPGNFTSKSINTTATIRQIVNITWDEVNTDSENNNLSIEISADNGANWYNVSKGESFSNFTEGSALKYRVLFNTNNSRTLYLDNFTINWTDLGLPSISITYPEDNSYTSNITSMSYSLTGDNLDTCWYTLDEGLSNTTFNCGSQINNIGSKNGENIWWIYVNNTAGYTDSDFVNFTVDTQDPFILLNSPENESQFLTSSVNFNWTVTDNVDNVLLCNITLDGEVSGLNINSENGNSTLYGINNIQEGNHYWNITCVDNVGRTTTSETREFDVTIQTTLKQIIKGYGITSGAITDVTLSPSLSNVSKAFHIISYSHDFANDHADTFKSSEIINETTLRIYSAGANNAVNFRYIILEFEEESPLFVQRLNNTITTSSVFPLNFPLNNEINLSESFLIYEGHTHEGSDSTIGSEELERIRLINETTVEYNVAVTPNSGPQTNRLEIVDWNDAGFIDSVQRGIDSFGSAQITKSIMPPNSIDPNRTLLFINYMEGTNNAYTTDASQLGISATISDEGNIELERDDSGTELLLSWQLIEFEAGVAKVQRINASFLSLETQGNFSLNEPVNENRSVAFSPVSIPFGHSTGMTSDTTGGAINSFMFSINLVNSTHVQVSRGNDAGSAEIGIQILEITGSPTISNVNVTNILDTSVNIIWDTNVASNSTVEYGIDENLTNTKSSQLLVTDHVVGLNNLISNTTYFYNVTSCNPNGCDEQGTFNFTTSTTPAQAPLIFLMNPLNNTFQNYSQVIFSYNISDINDDIANTTLIINGQRNITNQTLIVNNALNNFSLNLSDGVYNWNVNSTDLSGLEGTNSSERVLTIDTHAPNITLHYPEEDSSHNENQITFNFTIIDNLDNSMVCDLIIDNQILEDDFTSENNSIKNFTETLSPGNHSWNVTCIDDSGNLGVSDTWNFSTNDEPPTVVLITDNETFFNSSIVVLEYNATDNFGFEESKLILNGVLNQTNQTPIINREINNFTLSLEEGVYNWSVNVTDTGGFNATSDIRIFTVDKTSPNISLNLPLGDVTINSSDINFNFTVNDNLDSLLTCNLSVGAFQDSNFNATEGNLTNRFLSGLYDGVNYWNVTCIDDSGNINISESRLINITDYPEVNLTTDNNSFFNSTSVTFSYIPSDNMNLSSCSLFLDGVFNRTNQTPVINGNENFFDLTGIIEGNHNWSVLCEDTFGLQTYSETRFFTVDTDGLSVEIIYPTDGAYLFTNNLNFSYNVTDNLDSFLDCNITINGFVEDNYTASSGEITNRTIYFSEGGFKLWNVTCKDDSGNTVTSDTWNFTLAFSPKIYLENPLNNTFQNSSSATFEYLIVDDNDDIANATLIINGQRNITNQTTVINEDVNSFTLNLPDGVYNWTVNSTDLSGLEGTNSSERVLTIDTQSPNVTLNEPFDDGVETWNNISFNFSVEDNLDDLLVCDLYIDGSLNVTGINAQNSSETIQYQILHDGEYNWSILCRDNADNIGFSSTFNFSVEAPPSVSLLEPSEDEFTNQSTVQFSYIPEDPIGLGECSLILDGNQNKTNYEPDNGIENSFTVPGISEGIHNWTVECEDSDLNIFKPE
ncbi:fibronectin type III domain-containing protein, partial [Candidatus Pacearchaeota archaeon]|nr:fibronectin type III domain-containing protein [Candidatus Pacearchaeota archaeon]